MSESLQCLNQSVRLLLFKERTRHMYGVTLIEDCGKIYERTELELFRRKKEDIASLFPLSVFFCQTFLNSVDPHSRAYSIGF